MKIFIIWIILILLGMKGKVIPLEMFAKKKKYCDVVIPNDEN